MPSIRMFTHKLTDQSGTEYQAQAYDDGRICSTPEPPVSPGMVLTDSIDNRQYLILDTIPILNRNRQTVFYYESLTAKVNTVLSISRVSQATSKNAFGRDTDAAPVSVASNIPAHISTGSAGIKDSPDGPRPTGKTTTVIQACEVQTADRITTDQQETFQVTAIDRYKHKGLLVLTLSADHR